MNKFLLAAFLLCICIVTVTSKRPKKHSACYTTCVLIGHLKAKCYLKKKNVKAMEACNGGVRGYCACYCSKKKGNSKMRPGPKCRAACKRTKNGKAKCASRKTLKMKYACYGWVGGYCKCSCSCGKAPKPRPKTVVIPIYKHPGCTKCAPCFHACMACTPCVKAKSKKCDACHVCKKCAACLHCLNWKKTEVAY